MHNKEAIEMMNRCAAEITELRRRIAELAPKAEAYDNITAILRLLPRPSVGYGEDLVWTLKRRVEALKEESDERSANPADGPPTPPNIPDVLGQP